MAALICQPVQAALLNESGSSILADVNGPVTPANPASEQLTVDWSVVESAGGIYTYTYTVVNPANDVLLPPYSGFEEFETFTVNMDTDIPGIVLPGTISGGGVPTGDSIFWVVPAVYSNANTPESSDPLSFESDFAPELGDASATDSNPPSPWSSVPYGQQVPVPGPDATSTLALLGGMLMVLPVVSRLVKKPAVV